MVKNKRNNSESDGADHGGRLFRISVCLKQFFHDERSLACVQVDSAQPVRWLRRRLRRAFALPRSLRLLSRGHLLPPDEPLALLERDDLVQVVAVPQQVLHLEDLADSDYDQLVNSKLFLEQPTTQVPVRSPTPDRTDLPEQVDNLLESKQRAFQLLEQYSSVEDQNKELEPETSARRSARRRRVRRRRRNGLPVLSSELVEYDGVSSALDVKVMEGTFSTSDVNGGEMSTAVETDSLLAMDTVDACVGEVLRNTSPARPPRVVRPLEPLQLH
ncbi:unnamed protein product [Chrysodeixis includens]|uniref:Coilin n=1 Tax=Chrysodeixis includens TaxID=689277 RepID=A0A9P0FZJ5_CHRIL|nr:unnamed protein product [Chrysodeixis includens]